MQQFLEIKILSLFQDERGPRGRALHLRLRKCRVADARGEPVHPAERGAALAAALLGAQVEAAAHPPQGAARQGHQRSSRGKTARSSD